MNSGAGTSTVGSSERTEDALHQPADNHAANNFESELGMAIIPAMPASTPLNTSTGNSQVDGTAAHTEVNDETDDDAASRALPPGQVEGESSGLQEWREV